MSKRKPRMANVPGTGDGVADELIRKAAREEMQKLSGYTLKDAAFDAATVLAGISSYELIKYLLTNREPEVIDTVE